MSWDPVPTPCVQITEFESKIFVFQDGSWSPEPQTVIKLGVLPVRSLVMTEDTLWAASGGQVFTISAETHTIEVSPLSAWHRRDAS